MGLLCSCPQGAALDNLPITDCPESLGQLQKVAFQRVYSAPGVKNGFDLDVAEDPEDPTQLASWTPYVSATDSTKVVVSPYLHGPTSEPGAAREYGGGNETVGGIPIIVGREPSTMTTQLIQQPQAVIEALKSYQCENIGVYLIDEYGRIAGLVDDHENPTFFGPIPIASLFVGDKMLGGLEEADRNELIWRFFPNWSDKLKIYTPEDFNALTDLAAS